MSRTMFFLVLIYFCPLPCSAETIHTKGLSSHQRGAKYLLAKQNKNGSWGMIPGLDEKGELGLTSMAISALAKAPKSTAKSYREACGKAVEWLLKHQNKDGSFSQKRTGLVTYRTSLALMALKDFDGERYAEQIKRAANWIVGAQIKDGGHSDGAWGYGRDKKPKGDLSNVSMALSALKQSGVKVDSAVYKRAAKFIGDCQNSTETNPGRKGLKILNDGGSFYKPTAKAGEDSIKNADGTVSHSSYSGMTYAGLMSLLYSEVKKEDPRVKAARRWIRENYSLDKNTGLGSRSAKAGADQAGLYYFYMAFAKCMTALGERSVETKTGDVDWALDLTKKLMKKQKPAGYWVNDKNGRWWEGRPLLPTLYALQALNRTLPKLAKD